MTARFALALLASIGCTGSATVVVRPVQPVARPPQEPVLVTLHSPFAGTLGPLRVAVGDVVHRGDIVAPLVKTVLDDQILALRRDIDRRLTRQPADASLDTDLSRLVQLTQAARHRDVRSSVDGVVVAVLAHDGDSVAASSPIATIRVHDE